MPHSNEDVQNLTYEEARDELIAIVAKLEAGAATLDESVGLWERGEALGARCQELLDGAHERINAASGNDEAADALSDAGIIGTVPADPAEDDDEGETQS
ncbi:exodeoxyribonuclease VII small subunit [Demequina flava]|uniref:exodeoxyribonuclease VII small subunit n=1 Tax=Demequina flava TaxID=1095025 RepID=UPI0009E224CE|nr:exodeoxyribonuclease VII small subunit [Demequina flava]